MPYAEDKPAKFDELYGKAFAEISNEPNFDEEMQDANLAESDIKNEVAKKSDEIWKVVDVQIGSFDSIEEDLKNKESQVEEAVERFVKTEIKNKTRSSKRGTSVIISDESEETAGAE